MRLSVRRRGKWGLSIAAMVGLLAGGCSSDPHGLPFGVDFVNWTDQTLSIVDVGTGGDEEVLIASMPPRSHGGLSMAGDQFGRCSRGNYLARNPSGQEVARHPDNHCHDWAITLAPVAFTITNPTSEPARILYENHMTVEVAARVDPGATVTGTVDTFGDPSDLCTGGFLGALPVSRESVSPSFVFEYDRSIPKRDVFSCSEWTWAVGCSVQVPPGATRPSIWPADESWPPCS